MVDKEQPEHASSINIVWSRIAAMLVTIVLVAVVFILVAFFGGGATSSRREAPHIIFILADDLVSDFYIILRKLAAKEWHDCANAHPWWFEFMLM